MYVWRRYAVAAILLFVMLGWPSSRAVAHAHGDSIKVHGAWTIELRNPDGSLAARHQFNNALLQPGGDFLARLLGGTQTLGEWAVTLASRVGEAICANGVDCFLRQNPPPGEPRLIVDVPATGPHAGRLVLRGTVNADTTGVIQSVVTQQINVAAFSEKFLAPTIAVTAGQTVSVTVVFSFS